MFTLEIDTDPPVDKNGYIKGEGNGLTEPMWACPLCSDRLFRNELSVAVVASVAMVHMMVKHNVQMDHIEVEFI